MFFFVSFSLQNNKFTLSFRSFSQKLEDEFEADYYERFHSGNQAYHKHLAILLGLLTIYDAIVQQQVIAEMFCNLRFASDVLCIAS